MLLPPNKGYDAGSWARERTTNITIKQLRLPDLQAALLPNVVTGPLGESVQVYKDWISRERFEIERTLRR